MKKLDSVLDILQQEDWERLVSRFSTGHVNYMSYRSRIYEHLKARISGYGRADRVVLTSIATWRVAEVCGMTFQDFYEKCPDWAQKDLEGIRKQQQEKENMSMTMNDIKLEVTTSRGVRYDHPPIETVTFIYGKRLEVVTDDDVYAALTAINAEISKLEALRHRPKSMTARLEALYKAQDEIIAAVDARDEARKAQ